MNIEGIRECESEKEAEQLIESQFCNSNFVDLIESDVNYNGSYVDEAYLDTLTIDNWSKGGEICGIFSVEFTSKQSTSCDAVRPDYGGSAEYSFTIDKESESMDYKLASSNVPDPYDREDDI